METSPTIAKLAEALAKAQAEFRAVPKNGRNPEFRYTYAELEDHVSTVRPVLAKHGLAIVTGVLEVESLPERKTRSGGTLYACRVRVAIRLLHVSGEWLEAQAVGEGLDTQDKALYKATTGARKYALACLLGLATTDDPEREQEVTPPEVRGGSGVTVVRRNPDGTEVELGPAARDGIATASQRACLRRLAENTRLTPQQTATIISALQRETTLTCKAAGALINKVRKAIDDASPPVAAEGK